MKFLTAVLAPSGPRTKTMTTLMRPPMHLVMTPLTRMLHPVTRASAWALQKLMQRRMLEPSVASLNLPGFLERSLQSSQPCSHCAAATSACGLASAVRRRTRMRTRKVSSRHTPLKPVQLTPLLTLSQLCLPQVCH